jgi:hypothetical protein
LPVSTGAPKFLNFAPWLSAESGAYCFQKVRL